LDFKALNTMRKVARGAANATEAEERRLGAIIIDSLDEYVDTAASTLGGTAKKARNLWGKMRRSEVIADAIENANNSSSGFEQGIRVEMRRMLKNKKKLRGFSNAEKAAMKQIVNGTKLNNITRNLGKLGFSGFRTTSNVVGGGIGLAGGAVLGGLPGLALVQGVSTGSRALSEAAQKRHADLLGAMVRSGKTPKQVDNMAKALASVGESETAFRSLVRSAGVGGINVTP
jgi:hypothetical protein